MVLQMLFQADMGKQSVDQVQSTFWAEHTGASAEVRGFAEDLFRVATDRGPEIDTGTVAAGGRTSHSRSCIVSKNL